MNLTQALEALERGEVDALLPEKYAASTKGKFSIIHAEQVEGYPHFAIQSDKAFNRFDWLARTDGDNAADQANGNLFVDAKHLAATNTVLLLAVKELRDSLVDLVKYADKAVYEVPVSLSMELSGVCEAATSILAATARIETLGGGK